MTFKNSIRDSILQNGEIKEKRENRTKRCCDSFFEDYTQTFVPRRYGSGYTVKRVYIGALYRPEPGGRKYFFNRLVCFALYGLVCFLLIHTGAAPMEVNCAWYVGIAQALCIFFLGWLTIALIYNLAGCGLAGGKGMTVYTYKSMAKHFKISLNGLMGACTFLTVMNVLWLFLHTGEMRENMAIVIFAYAISLLAVALMRYMENSLRYIGVKS